MHLQHTSLGLATVVALALGTGAVACGAADTSPVGTNDVAGSTDAALTANVKVGAILVVTRRVRLLGDPVDGDILDTLEVGDHVVAVEAAPNQGYYHVSVTSDEDGWVRGTALKLLATSGSGTTTPDAGAPGAKPDAGSGGSVPAPPAGSAKGRVYPMHTNIVATTFWVGELFNATLADGSQVCSTYDPNWAFHWSGVNTGTVPATASGCAGSILGGCDGKISGTACLTEPRTAANGYFPSQGSPKENPFYLDLPFDDVNDATAFASRCTTIPWANDPGYLGHCSDTGFSYMKNRWVRIVGPNGHTCYGQNEDAGPSHGSLYHDAAYVFGSANAQPVQGQFNNAGMDVSPALNGCLGFAELDGQNDRITWQFVDDVDVPAGPWKTVVTTSQVQP